MNSTDLLEQFRSDLNDLEEPYLWSDKEILGYMNDAQRMFCRLVGGIGDVSSPFTRLEYTPASDWIATSPLILKYRNATDLATGRQIDIWNEEDMRSRGIRFNGVPGRVQRLVIGMEEHRARLHNFPAQAGTIQISVERLPLAKIDAPDQEFEIDEQHHEHLGLWMSYRAYSKQDAETFDRTKSAEFKLKFELYCFEAAAERARAQSKIRVVRYGGI